MSGRWFAPTPDVGEPPELWPDLLVMTSTVLGEAEGEPLIGKIAVAYVIMNRVADQRWPDTASEVCLQRLQFSSWNRGSARLAPMRDPKKFASERVWNECFRAALDAAFKLEPDPTLGANSYLAAAHLTVLPIWAEASKITVKIGNHTFYRL